jgi:hypothetical protein
VGPRPGLDGRGAKTKILFDPGIRSSRHMLFDKPLKSILKTINAIKLKIRKLFKILVKPMIKYCSDRNEYFSSSRQK